MNCLDARTLANRENARKSTGPRTEAGKERSRANAYKHGLAGEGVAWPGEHQGQMRAFVEEQVAAEPVPPRDARESQLLERIAMIAWQVDRAERAEEARVVIRASTAEEAEEERRDEEVSRLVGLIEAEPSRAVRGLLRTKHGCQWIIDSLQEMIDAVDADWWLARFDDRLDALCAPAQPGRLRISRAKALALALGSAEYGAVWPNGVPGLEPIREITNASQSEHERSRGGIARQHYPAWRAELRSILERRLAEVRLRRDELAARPDPGLTLAALASTFDDSVESERLRRYIRSRENQRRRLIEELEQHRMRRDEHPNECEPQPETPPEPAPEPPPPLTPMSPPPDSVRNDEGYGLRGSDDTAKWVRPGDLECGSAAAAFPRPKDEEKPAT